MTQGRSIVRVAVQYFLDIKRPHLHTHKCHWRTLKHSHVCISRTYTHATRVCTHTHWHTCQGARDKTAQPRSKYIDIFAHYLPTHWSTRTHDLHSDARKFTSHDDVVSFAALPSLYPWPLHQQRGVPSSLVGYHDTFSAIGRVWRRYVVGPAREAGIAVRSPDEPPDTIREQTEADVPKRLSEPALYCLRRQTQATGASHTRHYLLRAHHTRTRVVYYKFSKSTQS